jgi:hypothetical protein
MTLSSSRHTEDSCADSSLGGGSPTYTITVGGVLQAGAPPDAIPTAIEDRLRCLPSLASVDRFHRGKYAKRVPPIA